ncbi:hypothetical protein EON65_45925 [archaeon]|nr:MAG: hypothetical protein EON65_45925 [archaeon]
MRSATGNRAHLSNDAPVSCALYYAFNIGWGCYIPLKMAVQGLVILEGTFVLIPLPRHRQQPGVLVVETHAHQTQVRLGCVRLMQVSSASD